MIYLYQLPKFKDDKYSASPFCLKLELYLKVMNIDYRNEFGLDFNKSPTGKLPFIETQGCKYADSNLIIEMLESKSEKSIDEHLSREQKAQALAFIRLCEDSLYWSCVYSRWADPDQLPVFKRELQQVTKMPKIVFSTVFPAMKKMVQKQLKSQGATKVSRTEIYQKANKDLQAISGFLDGREYFFNDKFSLVDIVVFSFLVMIASGSCGNRLKYAYDQLDLGNFVNNMNSKMFEGDKF